jgi:hypothetical protein
VPWRNDAGRGGGGGGGEALNVRVSEPAFFRKSMDATDVWNASTFVATD